tara:strand:- start:1198 stop:2529 length:1332 start_codon:yes stop_codon:yes gene_type:complete
VTHYYDRPRVIYQTEALYTSLDATGYHFGNNTAHDISGCLLRNESPTGCSGNLVRQLHRIQSVNFDYKINWTNVDQYGQGARLDFMQLTTPDITLDFEYLLADGYNEKLMGFHVDGTHQALRNHIYDYNRKVGANFFLLTSDYGHDAIGTDLSIKPETKRIVGIGNAFLSQYALVAEVDKLPRARATFEGFNIRSYNTGVCNLPLPSVNPNKDCILSELGSEDLRFSLPDPEQGILYEQVSGMEDIYVKPGTTALRPGDIRIDLQNRSMVTEQVSGFSDTHGEVGQSSYDRGAGSIQGFALNIPLGNTRMHRVGTHLEWTRSVNFPVNVELQVDAIVGELKKGGFATEYCKNPFDIRIVLHDCRCLVDCCNVAVQKQQNMTVEIRKATLTNEDFQSSIGDNKQVTLKFTAQLGSEDDEDSGVFISGKSFIPEKPNILAWGVPL